jgi:hypothetical protein
VPWKKIVEAGSRVIGDAAQHVERRISTPPGDPPSPA